ncbi:hypothetical protein CBER1_05254 [Cercospora berteroae]|uniref:Uncharacterized protein n=1 Tax=Cercospora berteroae TaxID=357750 RepID=A0A2S6BT84_9PEZI|nr:hypothetical protein CBER1_05254 [Cercospora berteroae]
MERNNRGSNVPLKIDTVMAENEEQAPPSSIDGASPAGNSPRHNSYIGSVSDRPEFSPQDNSPTHLGATGASSARGFDFSPRLTNATAAPLEQRTFYNAFPAPTTNLQLSFFASGSSRQPYFGTVQRPANSRSGLEQQSNILSTSAANDSGQQATSYHPTSYLNIAPETIKAPTGLPTSHAFVGWPAEDADEHVRHPGQPGPSSAPLVGSLQNQPSGASNEEDDGVIDLTKDSEPETDAQTIVDFRSKLRKTQRELKTVRTARDLSHDTSVQLAKTNGKLSEEVTTLKAQLASLKFKQEHNDGLLGIRDTEIRSANWGLTNMLTALRRVKEEGAIPWGNAPQEWEGEPPINNPRSSRTFPSSEMVRSFVSGPTTFLTRLLAHFAEGIVGREAHFLALVGEKFFVHEDEGIVANTDLSDIEILKMKHKTPRTVRNASRGAAADFPTVDEVRAFIPNIGVTYRALLAMFRRGVGNRKEEFRRLVTEQAGQESDNPWERLMDVIKPRPQT